MRQQLAVGMAAALLAGLPATSAAAGDEDLRMGDDPAYFQRVELPEDGLAISVPGDWSVDPGVEYHPAEDGDPDYDRWTIFFAADAVAEYCGISRRPHPGLELRSIVELLSDSWNESATATAEWSELDIAVGEAYRLDVHHLDDDEHSASFVFESDAYWYDLACHAPERDPDDWMDIAETLEWLPVDGDLPTKPGAEPMDPDETTGRALERVEVPDAGVAVSFPVGWEVDLGLEYKETVPGDPETGYWDVIQARDGNEGWCALTRHPHPAFEISEQAALMAQGLVESDYEDVTAEATSVELWTGVAGRVDSYVPGEVGFASTYLIDAPSDLFDEPSRFMLLCRAHERDAEDWLDVADSLEWLDGRVPDEADVIDDSPQWLDVPAAGVELAIPAEWTFEPEVAELSAFLPPPYDDVGEVAILRALEASGPDGAWCNVYAYETMPMTLEQHADWFGSMVGSNAEYPATVETSALTLPIGAAIRSIERYDAGEVHVVYLFDVDGARRYLLCGAAVLPPDAWLSVAATIAPMPGLLPEMPDDAVDWSEVNDVVTALPVTPGEAGETYLHAECPRATWFEFGDGSYEEHLTCRLTDDPVEDQGRLPFETVTLSGGACEWVSDFWMTYDGSEFWASSWMVTVEPDGTATAISHYGAEELDCSG